MNPSHSKLLKAAEAAEATEGLVTTFPGGIASSGSKAGSSYDYLIAATYAGIVNTPRAIG